MKKIIITLAVLLLAAPVMAVVTVDCTVSGPNEVTVSFSASGEAELVRAIALDIQVNDPNVWIEDVNCADNSGYSIYPGSIDISPQGEIDDEGTCAGNIDGNDLISEQGSLYQIGVDTPPSPGDLFIITLGGCAEIGSGGDVVLTISENVLRGGIVMEDAGAPSSLVLNGVTISMDECVPVVVGCPCYADISGSTGPDPDNIVNTADLGKLLGLLGPLYGATPPYEVCPVPDGFDCMDLAGSTGPDPDGCINTADLGKLLGYLGPLYGASPPYEGPCMTLP